MSLSSLTYYQRVMGAMVIVLGVLVTLVRWWPAGTGSDASAPFRDRPTSPVQLHEIQPTSQAQEKTPPPPAPLPPIVVPNEVLITEDITFGDGEIEVQMPEDDDKLQQGTAKTTAAQQPDMGARLLKNVQPNYPPSARKDEVRARITVEVQVSETGTVRSASVTGRWRVYEDGSVRPVAELGYGLEEAALTAAQRSLFRPAQAQGRPVATRTTLTFTFGPR